MAILTLIYCASLLDIVKLHPFFISIP